MLPYITNRVKWQTKRHGSRKAFFPLSSPPPSFIYKKTEERTYEHMHNKFVSCFVSFFSLALPLLFHFYMDTKCTHTYIYSLPLSTFIWKRIWLARKKSWVCVVVCSLPRCLFVRHYWIIFSLSSQCSHASIRLYVVLNSNVQKGMLTLST